MLFQLFSKLSLYISNIDRTAVFSRLCYYIIFVFSARVSFLIRFLWFFIVARFFSGRNSMRRSLCSFDSCSRFAYSAEAYSGEAFTMVLSEIALPSTLCRPVLRTKSKLQRRIVKCHRWREIFPRIYLFFSTPSPCENAQGIETIVHYSKIDWFIWSPWKCARGSAETEYLMNFETARMSIWIPPCSEIYTHVLCKCANDICNAHECRFKNVCYTSLMGTSSLLLIEANSNLRGIGDALFFANGTHRAVPIDRIEASAREIRTFLCRVRTRGLA